MVRCEAASSRHTPCKLSAGQAPSHPSFVGKRSWSNPSRNSIFKIPRNPTHGKHSQVQMSWPSRIHETSPTLASTRARPSSPQVSPTSSPLLVFGKRCVVNLVAQVSEAQPVQDFAQRVSDEVMHWPPPRHHRYWRIVSALQRNRYRLTASRLPRHVESQRGPSNPDRVAGRPATRRDPAQSVTKSVPFRLERRESIESLGG